MRIFVFALAFCVAMCYAQSKEPLITFDQLSAAQEHMQALCQKDLSLVELRIACFQSEKTVEHMQETFEIQRTDEINVEKPLHTQRELDTLNQSNKQ